MVPKKKINSNDEIDLLEVFSAIWRKKFTILFATFLPAALMAIYITSKEPVKPMFEIKTKILPISIFEQLQYKNFNSNLEIYQNYINNFLIVSKDNYGVNTKQQLDNSAYDTNNPLTRPPIDISFFSKISRINLYNLFLEKINDYEFIIDTFKEYEIIKGKNYLDNKEYKDKILNYLNSIEFSTKTIKNRIIPEWYIHAKTNDQEMHLEYLKTLEKSVNLEIQNFLKRSFENTIVNHRELFQYKIEDLDLNIQISLSKSDENMTEYIEYLIKNKQMIVQNKSIQRLEATFATTPIMVNEKNFLASKIVVKSSEFNNLNRKKLQSAYKIMLTSIMGAIIGIFYVLILKKKDD